MKMRPSRIEPTPRMEPIQRATDADPIAYIRRTFDPRVAREIVQMQGKPGDPDWLASNADRLGRILHCVYFHPTMEVEAEPGPTVLDDLLDAHSWVEVITICALACAILSQMGMDTVEVMRQVNFLSPLTDGSDVKRSEQG